MRLSPIWAQTPPMRAGGLGPEAVCAQGKEEPPVTRTWGLVTTGWQPHPTQGQTGEISNLLTGLVRLAQTGHVTSNRD